MDNPITIFVAKKIITMNPSNPVATHIAVRDGKILGVGTLDQVKDWGPYTLDETFKKKILIPGLIEGHSHLLEGLTATFPYVGYFDRPGADGKVMKGFQKKADIISYLKEINAQITDPNSPLIALGFDPIYYLGERLSALDLDQVSATRTIFILHASGHIATVNTAMLKKFNIASDTKVPGVVRNSDGEPMGELQEASAVSLAQNALGVILQAIGSEKTLWDFGRFARNAGITTATDMASSVIDNPEGFAVLQQVINDAKFPVRLCVFTLPSLPGSNADWSAVAIKLKEFQQSASSEKLRFPGVKFVLDGSIQGWTAVLSWPGYFTRNDKGLMQVNPSDLKNQLLPFHKAGISIHAHCNGGEVIQLFIDTVEELLNTVPKYDHRHTVQHSQLTTAAQYHKMAKLGICANIFTNHIWYWGDQHYEITVGPERAMHMEACGSAKRAGVVFSLHSDASVTPLGQLHTMWCAVNRITPKGRVLGEEEKISVYDALHAVTLGAAYHLHMENEIGSIECGKRADFAVLDEDPLESNPMKLKDIPIWGTVLAGIKYQAE